MIKQIKNSKREDWSNLMERPKFPDETLVRSVTSILKVVEQNKDKALIKYALEFDKINLKDLQVSEAEIEKAGELLSEELKAAIKVAAKNIKTFHEAQRSATSIIETTKGVSCWRKNVGIDRVGLYIPGGTAPLFSTVLMLGIPAKIAQCKEIVICTPCNTEGKVHPAILFAAQQVGIQKIYKVGGAQAIAAMAFGTETIPKVNKIFGPGNQYVTKAKELLQQKGVAIDMPAGPSEILIIADQTGNPDFIAADLLSQAEHGPDSQVILLSDAENILEQTCLALETQLQQLPRIAIAKQALKNSKAILLKDMQTCIDFSNQYAPEHLIIASDNADWFEDKISNAGSVFVGNYSCESAGDYASGTNHTLPTNGFAKSYSGVSLDSFVKKITFQKLTKEGISNLGHTIAVMAEAEGLFAHKNAVTIRLNDIENE